MSGILGRPDECVDRSTSRICRPFREGTTTSRGSNSATGWSTRTSPRSAISARRMPVNTFVIEPISKSVRPS